MKAGQDRVFIFLSVYIFKTILLLRQKTQLMLPICNKYFFGNSVSDLKILNVILDIIKLYLKFIYHTKGLPPPGACQPQKMLAFKWKFINKWVRNMLLWSSRRFSKNCIKTEHNILIPIRVTIWPSNQLRTVVYENMNGFP